jgi:hypothetical protein
MSCTSCSYKVPLASFLGALKSERVIQEEQKCTQLMCFVEQNKYIFNSAIASDWNFVNEFNRCRQLLDGDSEWRVRETKRC